VRAIKKAFVMMTGTSVNNKDADVLLIQEVFNLLVINEWDRKQPLCLKIEPGQAVCLALSNSRKKALETDPIKPCRNYRNSNYSGRGVYHQRIQHIQPR
jgi:hypothetical protein